MLVLFCLSENGKYDVTRKGKPSSTTSFSSLHLASVGGWSSTATATAAVTARSFCLGVFHAPPGQTSTHSDHSLGKPRKDSQS